MSDVKKVATIGDTFPIGARKYHQVNVANLVMVDGIVVEGNIKQVPWPADDVRVHQRRTKWRRFRMLRRIVKDPGPDRTSFMLRCNIINSRIGINVHDMGAVGDGKHDDGPALQRAVDLNAKVGGGKVRLPPGTYAMDGPLNPKDSTLSGQRR